MSDATARDGVQLRTLLIGGLPLLVASLVPVGRAAQLRDALAHGGVTPLETFIGAELPRGARLGFVLEPAELRLVDEQDDALLRAPREGLDSGWVDRAVHVKGTMFVLVEDLDLSGREPAPELASALDAAAQAGAVRGAIVGVVEERPRLPLLF